MAKEIYTFDLQRSQLYEQVAEKLQEMVLSESLVPGDRLPGERDLAKRLGISRTVLREAIRVLEGRGLLKVKPGCGTYVSAMTAQDAAAPLALMLKLSHRPDLTSHLGEVRRMIEIEAAGLAAERAEQADITALEKTLITMGEMQNDAQAYTAQDLAFHMRIAEATHNQVLPMLLTPIADYMSGLILLSLQPSEAPLVGLAHHGRIVERIKSSDVSGARQAMREHLDAAEQLVRAALDLSDQNPDR